MIGRKRTASLLAPQELSLMKVIWRTGHATVREVYEALRGERPVAYTTVMTVMKILEAKGHLRKEAEGRAYRYYPTAPSQAVIGTLVREFVERVLDGSAQPLLAHLVRDSRLTPEQRTELRRLIDEVES